MRGSLGVVVLALVLGPLAQAAHAGDAVDAGGAADAPVTSPDTIEVLGRTPIAPYYGEDLVNVLLNDSDPNGDPLTVCDYEVPVDAEISVAQRGDTTFAIGARPNTSTTYDITYYACDGAHRTPGTLRVVVVRVEPIQATVLARPGMVRFSNINTADVPLGVDYGKAGGGTRIAVRDRRLRYMKPGESTTVRVSRHRIAYHGYGQGGLFGGRGVLSGIDLPEHARRDAPRTEDDYYRIHGLGPTMLGCSIRVTCPLAYTRRTTSDLLANDIDPNGDRLTICETDRLRQQGLRLLPAETYGEGPKGAYVVYPHRNRSRIFTFEYFACDGHYRTRGRLVVEVVRVEPVTAVRVAPGVVELANPSVLPMSIAYGLAGSKERLFDSQERERLRLEPGESTTLSVGYERFAYRSRSPRAVSGGEGIIRASRPGAGAPRAAGTR